MLSEYKKWDKRTSDSNKIWGKVDWKGWIQHGSKLYATILQLQNHFENIYETNKLKAIENINDISNDVYLPILDEPITGSEIKKNIKELLINFVGVLMISHWHFYKIWLTILCQWLLVHLTWCFTCVN